MGSMAGPHDAASHVFPPAGAIPFNTGTAPCRFTRTIEPQRPRGVALENVRFPQRSLSSLAAENILPLARIRRQIPFYERHSRTDQGALQRDLGTGRRSAKVGAAGFAF